MSVTNVGFFPVSKTGSNVYRGSYVVTDGVKTLMGGDAHVEATAIVEKDNEGVAVALYMEAGDFVRHYVLASGTSVAATVPAEEYIGFVDENNNGEYDPEDTNAAIIIEYDVDAPGMPTITIVEGGE